ncbi:MAG TPA: FecR domain-containing protein [Pedobacter sp.]|uniref:FecR family protein n=1 Tax=Pedobacter sp. TaxID=1411316 RepID=UPI002CD8A5F5|nr:FecR domain-containing protein [Pedobacter sp.]HMI02918.1 FecR domain-containing protein [Pedobacter sp.]
MRDFHKQHFLEILKKYRKNIASAEEIKFLEAYYDVFEANEPLISNQNEADFVYLKENIKKEVDRKIIRPKGIVKKISWLKYTAAAAAVLVLLSLSWFFFAGNNETDQVARIDKNISPGGNKATLTLAGGQMIILNDAATGEIARQSGISITKTDDGQIVYSVAAGDGEVLQNTIETPRGGQYRVILPDGTNVLLNAASSLAYPTAFKGAERLVQLNGEAYFEVAKNKNMPFRVRSGGQTVEVLGTHFNINAYEDERSIKTTLVEGSVRVFSSNASSLLSPGQQAVLSRKGDGIISIRNVNLDKETAWKSGMFSFEDDDIKSVMRSIARWYDVDVSYKDDMSDIVFSGEIFRTARLSEVFKILELNNVQLDVHGKTIIVSYDDEAQKTPASKKQP